MGVKNTLYSNQTLAQCFTKTNTQVHVIESHCWLTGNMEDIGKKKTDHQGVKDTVVKTLTKTY